MTWKPGQSGNPAGVNVRQARARAMLEGLSLRAIGRIEKLMESENEAIALAASKEVLSRVVPVPKNGTLTIEHNASPHLSALVGLAAATAARVQAVPQNNPQVIDITSYATIDVQSEPVDVDVDGGPGGAEPDEE